jgi:hypothetical protein
MGKKRLDIMPNGQHPSGVMKNEMTQAEFWNLPEVKRLQDIQKFEAPYGTKEHREAFEGIKALLTEHKGAEFAQENMGDYED